MEFIELEFFIIRLGQPKIEGLPDRPTLQPLSSCSNVYKIQTT